MQTTLSNKPIELKIATLVAVSAILRESNPAVLDAALRELTEGAPDFFENEIAVVDVGALDLTSQPLDWPVLITLLKSYQLNPVAVRNAPVAMNAEILAHGLSIDVMTQSQGQSRKSGADVKNPPAAIEIAPAVRPVAELVQPLGSMIVDTPVRAGQRIYARGSDLIVTAGVNNGAEVIADGSIHIYGQLRGRALAGASGYTAARIFTMSMEAELVSIAGMYRTFENELTPELNHHAAQIRLINEHIDIQAIRPASKF